MSDLPYMPLWVSKYEARTAHLTFEEHGVYLALLRLCWKTPGCTIPADDAWVRRHLRCDEKVYARLVAPVLAEFFQVARRRYVNVTLKRIFDETAYKSAQRKIAGKIGGEAKARKKREKLSGKTRLMLEQNSTIPEPDPETGTDRDLGSGVAHGLACESTVARSAAVPDLDAIAAACVNAANGAIDVTAPSIVAIDLVLRWLKPAAGEPCTMADVISGIAEAAATVRARGDKISSWRYFEKAVLRHRDSRLKPLPDPENPDERTRAASTSAGHDGRGRFAAYAANQHRENDLVAAAMRLRARSESQNDFSS